MQQNSVAFYSFYMIYLTFPILRKYLLAVFINNTITVCCIGSAFGLVGILKIEAIASRIGFFHIIFK